MLYPAGGDDEDISGYIVVAQIAAKMAPPYYWFGWPRNLERTMAPSCSL